MLLAAKGAKRSGKEREDKRQINAEELECIGPSLVRRMPDIAQADNH
jgi:hypothetical protein